MAVAVRALDLLQLDVHVVLAVQQFAAVRLAGDQFRGDGESDGLMEEFDGDAQAHLICVDLGINEGGN